MLSKSFIATILLLASISSTNAHAGVSPALGVKGQMVRANVQRPSANTPCGNVNVAQNLDSSTAVPADANGNFSPSITDFNAGADGSRSIQKVQVDASGTGKTFVAAKMITNGNAAPATVGTDKLTAQLPAGTKCTGGANKDLCLASFTTTAGFGNCVVVSQGAGASNAPAPRSIVNGAAKGMIRAANSSAADGGDQKGQSSGAAKKDNKKKKGNKKGKGNKKAKNDAAGKAKNDAAGNAKNDAAVKAKNDAAGKAKNNKAGKKGKDAKKADNKKGGKKADKKAKGTPAAADGKNSRRSWSSRQMGNFA